MDPEITAAQKQDNQDLIAEGILELLQSTGDGKAATEKAAAPTPQPQAQGQPVQGAERPAQQQPPQATQSAGTTPQPQAQGASTPATPTQQEANPEPTPGQDGQEVTPPETPTFPAKTERELELERQIEELKLEQEKALLAGQEQTIKQAQQNFYQQYLSDTELDRAEADRLFKQWQQLSNDGYEDDAEAIARTWNVLNNSIRRTEAYYANQFRSFAQGHQSQYAERQAKTHERTLEVALKPHGLTVADLKAADEKLDLSNPYKVTEAVTKALASRVKDLETKLSQAKDEAEKEAKKKWDNHPAAQRDPAPSLGQGSSAQDLANMSTYELIGAGLKELFQ